MEQDERIAKLERRVRRLWSFSVLSFIGLPAAFVALVLFWAPRHGDLAFRTIRAQCIEAGSIAAPKVEAGHLDTVYLQNEHLETQFLSVKTPDGISEWNTWGGFLQMTNERGETVVLIGSDESRDQTGFVYVGREWNHFQGGKGGVRLGMLPGERWGLSHFWRR